MPTRSPRPLHAAVLLLVAGALAPAAARAQPALRLEADLRGDVAVTGSTLAFDCGAGQAAPPGVVATCAGQVNVADPAPDLYLRDLDANASIAALQARTSATLDLPPSAVVKHARLYWAALRDGAAADTSAVLDFLDGPQSTCVADQSWVVPAGLAAHPTWHFYQSTADVTDYVAAWGAGSFRVTGVEALDLAGALADRAFSAWTLVVLYEVPGAPLRHVALHDGLSPIDPGVPGSASTSVTLAGFSLPPGFDARVGLFAYEGDPTLSGDHLTLDATRLSNALNPADDFLNSSRTELGAPRAGAFDLPRISGQPGTMAGYDLDTVDVTGLLTPGATSCVVGVDSTGDAFLLGGIVTSVSTHAPYFAQVLEEVSDLDGGALLKGDHLQYTVRAVNQGTAPATEASIVDVLDEGLELVPGTLELVEGGAAGVKTEAAGDDEADYDAATRTITWRVGAGAGASLGGALAPGDSVVVRFTVRPLVSQRPLPNQATLRASGRSWRADGDPLVRGEQPTTVTASDCLGDADCGGTTPRCDLSSHGCAPCLTDFDCGDPARPACLPSGACGQCSATNTALCGGSTPACEPVGGTCVLCTPGPSGDARACRDDVRGLACVAEAADLRCGCLADDDCLTPACARDCDEATRTCAADCRPPEGTGCGCSGAGGAASPWALALVLGLAARSRRRRNLA